MILEETITLENKAYLKKATIYRNSGKNPTASILYFHGGGLLYGSRKDLPHIHIEMLTNAGYQIIAFDYPLAPMADLTMICADVLSSIHYFCTHREEFSNAPLPYFLWGRSSGAYLCLLAASKSSLTESPIGILSYYGYGFLCDNWMEEQNSYYNTFPKVPATCFQHLPKILHCEGPLETHYCCYVYVRQQGLWKDKIYQGREKFFLLDYSLRLVNSLPCPIFCTHATNDTDVPFVEFQELSQKYHGKRFIVSENIHDFDRDENSENTKQLLKESILFLNECLSKRRGLSNK